MRHLLASLCCSLLVLSQAGCDQRDVADLPDVAYLATNGHFIVGDRLIVVPFVAVESVMAWESSELSQLSPDDHERLLELAGNSTKPLKVRKMRLQFSSYGTFGEFGISKKICPLLSVEWAISLCYGKKPGELKNLPDSLEILDRSVAKENVNTTTVGGEERSNQLSKMKFRISQTEVVCDLNSHFCTSAVAVSPGLLAVWSVWSEEKQRETAQEMGLRQGKAIYWFLISFSR
jgi:hypothetical protein